MELIFLLVLIAVAAIVGIIAIFWALSNPEGNAGLIIGIAGVGLVFWIALMPLIARFR